MQLVIRYGILGFGHHAVKRFISAFAGADESILSGIWRRDENKARANAAEFGIEHIFSSAGDLCASPLIDAVLITSPDALHMHDTLLALANGKPVLCEKPLAMSSQEVKEMLAAARHADVAFGVAQNFRYNRSVNLVRKWIADGRIGKPVFATAQFYFNSGGSPRKWIYDTSLACGGAIGDVGIHCIDVLRFILNDNPVAISTLARSDQHSDAIDASAALALDFLQGTLGSVLVSFRSEYRTRIEITGECGTIESHNCLSVDDSVSVTLRKDDEIIEQQQVSNADAYSLMLDAFSRTIRGSALYTAPGEDGLTNQRALDAAYASWRSGRKEIIPKYPVQR
jgi:predicted dehydrogenase